MNAHVNKFRKAQALNDKIMFSVLVVYSIIIAFSLNNRIEPLKMLHTKTSSTNYATSNNGTNSNLVNPDFMASSSSNLYISPINAQLNTDNHQTIEIQKLNARTKLVSQLAYTTALQNLSTIEEPENFITEINALQKSTVSVNMSNTNSLAESKANIFANAKNKSAESELNSFMLSYTRDHEQNLNVEAWMTDDEHWQQASSDEKFSVSPLPAALHVNTAQLDEELNIAWLLRHYEKDENDAPLTIESWMTGNEVWDLNKKQKNPTSVNQALYTNK